MLKIKTNHLLAVGIIFLVLSIAAVAAMKIPTSKCCTCPSGSYKVVSLVSSLNEISQKPVCYCKPTLPGTACTPSFYVIPLEFILAAVFVSAVLLYRVIRHKS